MSIDAVSALTDALSALATAEKAINIALSCIGADAPAPCTRQDVAARTTSDQVLSVLSSAGGPLTLIDVADGVVALRRGEDEPRKHGGTRYQEICRTALMHLIMRGLVERIDPHDRKVSIRAPARGATIGTIITPTSRTNRASTTWSRMFFNAGMPLPAPSTQRPLH